MILEKIDEFEEERKDLQELLQIRGLDYKNIVFANETINTN